MELQRLEIRARHRSLFQDDSELDGSHLPFGELQRCAAAGGDIGHIVRDLAALIWAPVVPLAVHLCPAISAWKRWPEDLAEDASWIILHTGDNNRTAQCLTQRRKVGIDAARDQYRPVIRPVLPQW